MRNHYLIKVIGILFAGGGTVGADEALPSLRGPNRDLETSDSNVESFHSEALKAQADGSSTTLNGEEPDPNDTGDRFEKFTMYDDKEKPNMQSVDAYPMSEDVSYLLSYHSDCHSVMTDGDYRMKDHDIEKYIDAVGGYPPRPSTDPYDEYWKEFRFVCRVQLERKRGNLPSDPNVWTPPDLWKDYNVTEVAEAVHDEYPGDNQAKLIEWFIINTGIKLDYSILPFRCRDDFIGTEVRLAALNTWAITTVAPINFRAKWYCGQTRPEEMAWRIHTGQIPREYVPEDVYQMVKDMKLTNATSYTQYPEGCPLHPSWPAMHSAASSLSLWLAVIAELTDEQYCQVLRMDYAVSFARTVAGVHYTSDNYAGLNMGQEVVAHELPAHLEKYYGADPDAVKAKIEKYRFDWRNFSPQTCRATVVPPLPSDPPSTPDGGVVVNPGPRAGCELKTVDFNEQPIGKYLTNEYAAYGLTLSASGGEGSAPRVFDTGNPGNEMEGDSDLGTPNQDCGGPGTGEGGKRGKLGENCKFLGNVLIVQEPGNDKMDIPDDNMEGGDVTLKFQGQYVKQIGLLDVDYEAKLLVEFNHSSGKALRTMHIPLLGDNSYQVINIDVEGVTSMKLDLRRSGSISFVSFCPTS